MRTGVFSWFSADKTAVSSHFGKGIRVVTPAVALPLLYQEKSNEWPGMPPYKDKKIRRNYCNKRSNNRHCNSKNAEYLSGQARFILALKDLNRARTKGKETEEMTYSAMVIARSLSIPAVRNLPVPNSFDCPNQGKIAEKNRRGYCKN